METALDYSQLACVVPEIKDHITVDKHGNSHFDWKNSDALRHITRAIFKVEYDLIVVLPEDKLCPRLTQRSNYLDWVESLPCTSKKSSVNVLDIGCGASCVFALLGFSKFGWETLCTDIDPSSIESSKTNVSLNSLEDKIAFVEGKEDELLSFILVENRVFDYVVCNPPFFEDATRPKWNQNSSYVAAKASKSELACSGGEVEFVMRIFEESSGFPNSSQWFTAMLGLKSSVKAITKSIRATEHRILLRSTELSQGKQMRWAIAWSFHPSVIELVSMSLNMRVTPISKSINMNFHASSAQELFDTLYRCLSRQCTVTTFPMEYRIVCSHSQTELSVQILQTNKCNFTAMFKWISGDVATFSSIANSTKEVESN